MLLSVNTSVHLPLNVELKDVTINGVAEWLFAERHEVLQIVFRHMIREIQEAYLRACDTGEREMVCRGCGVVQGPGGWVRRGTRERGVTTSSGRMQLALLQVTCRDCSKTRVAGEEALGLEPRQRVSTELKRRLVERVFATSYKRSAEVGRSCMGVDLSPTTLHRFVQESAEKLELTPVSGCETVVADGTKVRAGERSKLEDVRMAFQVIDRVREGNRPRARMRLLGLEVGRKTWPRVLGSVPDVKVVVTDAEVPLRAHVRRRYPGARHQQCEWHIGHTLLWSLRADGVCGKRRKPLRQELDTIIWGAASQRDRQQAYDAFTERLRSYPKTSRQLRDARSFILFDEPSPERTTSLIERQMREIDRRAWIGVRWSERGLGNLLRLSLAKTHNADDYARVWTS
jgi:hypothetical protein